MNTAPMRAVVAAHVAAAVAPTPAVAASAPLIVATAYAPAPLESVSVFSLHRTPVPSVFMPPPWGGVVFLTSKS